MKQFLIFVQKEFYHIFRDLRTVLILIIMPVLQIIIFGFAMSTELRNARVAVVDFSRDASSRAIVQQIDDSPYFTVQYADITSLEEIDRLFRRSEIDLAIVFDNDLSGERLSSVGGNVQLITDATDPNSATMAVNYATSILSSLDLPVHPNVKLLYNPSMESSYNFVPGVMGLILMLICAMMTSISIVREKERGTMEVLLVSPIKPIFILLAKVIPYFTLSIFNYTSILLLSHFALNVPIAGSLFWLTVLSLLFIFVSLSLGILISTLVKLQVVAMIISGLVLMMPTVMLSGMMFPIDNMPVPLQVISCFLPARWYIEGVKKLMIQGTDVTFVLREMAILFSMAVVLLTISLKKFKIRL